MAEPRTPEAPPVPVETSLTRFEDGQWVEVDGSSGVVRPLEADAASGPSPASE